MASWLDEAPERPERMIDAGVFYPKLSLKKFSKNYRIPAELPEETVYQALCMALIHVRRDLETWRKKQTEMQLVQIPAATVDGTSELLLLFERAVFCEAKAEILYETLTADQRKEANNNAKGTEDTEQKYRTLSGDAVSRIVGNGRIFIESI